MTAPMVKIGRVFEKTSARGNQYMVGRLGAARLLAFRDRDNPEVWNLFVQQVEEEGKNGRPGNGDERTRQADQAQVTAAKRAARQSRSQRKRPPADCGAPFYDDPVDDIGR